MDLILKSSAADFLLVDVGVIIKAGAGSNFSDSAGTDATLRKALGQSKVLRAMVSAATVVVNDGSSDLGITPALQYLNRNWFQAGGNVNVNLSQVEGTISDLQHGQRGGGNLHAAAVAGVSGGFMSSADKTKLDGLSSGTRAVLMWGNSLVSVTTTTRYLNPAFADATAGTTAISFRMPFACTLRNFYIRQNSGAGNGNNIVYTLLKNGVATALVVTIASTANDANDLVNTVVVAAGDRLDIEITKALSIGTSPGDILATMEAY